MRRVACCRVAALLSAVLLLSWKCCTSLGFVLVRQQPWLTRGEAWSKGFLSAVEKRLRRHRSDYSCSQPPLKVIKMMTMMMTSELVHDLDLEPLAQQVAAHTVTLRGRRALLQQVGMQTFVESSSTAPFSATNTARQRRASMERPFRKTPLILEQAANASQARHAYEWVEQATLVLHSSVSSSSPSSSTTTTTTTSLAHHHLDDKNNNELQLQLPPFYGPDGFPWDTTTRSGAAADSDDDEWLERPVMEWTLQNILEAEKIIQRLCNVHAWGQTNGATITWVPFLAAKASQIPIQALQTVYPQVTGAVEIVRVKTAMDPTGKSSFVFRLTQEKFPVLGLLLAKEADLQAKVQKDKNNLKRQEELNALKEEIQEKQDAIQRGLCAAIAAARTEIDYGLNVMAELDVWFAKAAFSMRQQAVIPVVQEQGCVHVSGFVHPLIETNSAVPVDLHLAVYPGNNASATSGTTSKARALVISGPNGGGKTVAMKSFGLVAQMVKLALPIPISSPKSASRPVVGFFDDIITALGDRQNVATGQSTFMAQLSTYAEILERLETHEGSNRSVPSVLVLLDELGSGTEAEGGGAIGQAILEHMLASSSCRVVATTHSSRLKTTSFQDDRFACATVLQEENSSGGKKPSYRLEYGLIGESFALEAAARAQPSLPASVLQRAAELCRTSEDDTSSTTDTSTDTAYLAALTASLEKQKVMATTARERAESYVQEMATCRAAMINLAKQYDRSLGYWESRVTDCYSKLHNDQSNSLEILGETLDEIRVAKKRVQSQAEKLKQRGLRLLPSDYVLAHGESVVIVDGTWDGAEGTVVLQQSTEAKKASSDKSAVWVSVSVSPLEQSQLAQLQRHQVAIWDYDSVFDDWDEENWSVGTSREESKRRLGGILSTLSTKTPSTAARQNEETTKFYTSARERKAAKKRKKR